MSSYDDDAARPGMPGGADEAGAVGDALDAVGAADAGAAPRQGPSEQAIALANALFAMARAGEAERIAAYLDAGAPLDMQNANGDTMLMLAAYHEQPATVRMLVGRGAALEIANDRGQRALSCAAFKEDVEACRALLEAGADPDGGTPSARQTVAVFGGSEDLKGLFA